MFDSLLRPSQIRTNNDAGLLRLIACVCMCIDHAGKMLFPELTWMRLVGRLAFPLFAYGIAVGAAMTKSPTRYLSRVMALVLISQPLYAVALDHTVIAMYDVPFTQNPLLAAWNFYIESRHAHLCPACRHTRLSAHSQADADAALVELWLLSGASAHFADS